MNDKKKIRVAVLYGGRSPEHEVSVASALNVIAHLDRSRFEVVPIKIDKQGNWFLEHEKLALPSLSTEKAAQKLFTPLWLKHPAAHCTAELAEWNQPQRTGGLFDVVFPIMHGTFSEDGTIQGLLELADIPYVGCGVLASAIGMDKDVARRLVSQSGIPTVPYIAVKQAQWKMNSSRIQAEVAAAFTFPLFVKPANQGSSIGVSKVKKLEDVAAAVEHALQFDTKVLIERAIPARELETGILESLEQSAPPLVSVVAEVRPHDEYYTYTAKYTDGGAEIFIPAAISEKIQQTIREFAQKIFLTLDVEGMARVDFFLDKHTEQIYFNEINSIPGFTLHSAYPQMMKASGIPYAELLTHLILLAVKRFEQRQYLKRSCIS